MRVLIIIPLTSMSNSYVIKFLRFDCNSPNVESRLRTFLFVAIALQLLKALGEGRSFAVSAMCVRIDTSGKIHV